MIKLENKESSRIKIYFLGMEEAAGPMWNGRTQGLFTGEYLNTFFTVDDNKVVSLLVGLGEAKIGITEVKEVVSKGIKVLKEKKVGECSIDISDFLNISGITAVREVVQGILLGDYEPPFFGENNKKELEIYLNGFSQEQVFAIEKEIEIGSNIAKGITWARDMVNMPGNHFRPEDFADEIKEMMKDTEVECEQISYEELENMGMNGLLAVGSSSEFPPCFLVFRYLAAPESKEITGLVGKGVTCDTGGYCLKPSNSMSGIRGDMAGGAAVAGAIYALAKNHIKTNVIGFIPMCENRISPGSLVPGDVISSYGGKSIEICNTDAEGRLILADAVSYAVKKVKVTRVLDIATLTGAVVNMLGFSTAGLISDNQDFFELFRNAYKTSGERYWRLPVYEEQEKMIKSKVADIKNMGEGHCGTITAALFIKAFAEGKPWIHLDIAGTAWVDPPLFEYQSKGATGAGVTSLYYLCSDGK